MAPTGKTTAARAKGGGGRAAAAPKRERRQREEYSAERCAAPGPAGPCGRPAVADVENEHSGEVLGLCRDHAFLARDGGDPDRILRLFAEVGRQRAVARAFTPEGIAGEAERDAALAAGLAAVDAMDARRAPGELRFRDADELIAEPPPEWVVDGVAVAGGVTVLVGEPNTGKTFVALDLAAVVGSGGPGSWHGRHAARGTVAFVSFEGDNTRDRLLALRAAGTWQHDLAHLRHLRAADPLSPRVDPRSGAEEPSRGERDLAGALAALAEELRDAGRPPVRLLIVDTLRASMSGSEDTSENVSAYLRAVRRLLAGLPGAGALVLHHSGWGDQRGRSRPARERGSSALRGNVDATLLLSDESAEGDDPGAQRLALSCLKMRDADRPEPLRLLRRTVELPGEPGPDGRPRTSCRIEPDRTSPAERHRAREREAEARERADDLATLRTVAARPDLATSQRRIASAAGIRAERASDALGRLQRAGHLDPPERRGGAYRVTASGRELLAPRDDDSDDSR